MPTRSAELLQPVPSAASRRAPASTIARAQLASEVAIAYLQARRALRHAPIESALCSLRSVPQRASELPAAEHLPQARRLGRAVTRVLGVLPGDTRCLVRSLVLTRLLAKRGIATTLVIGTRSEPDFLAHAWVEHNGEPVLSPGDGSFARLVEL